ncbi:hypothetical protein B0H11DRAFT_2054423 [Mycena galericulata]|nr:hypothetical protein B0H11DRAFT_2054423 [Mycena galericulata]
MVSHWPAVWTILRYASIKPTSTVAPKTVILAMSTPDFIQANDKYAASFIKPDRSGFKNVIISLKIGEAITIRNAGGSAKDALRSIIVAQHSAGVLGEIAVFHHKDCGMTHTTTNELREKVKRANPGRDDVAASVDGIDFYHINANEVEKSIKEDCSFLAQIRWRSKEPRSLVGDVATGKASLSEI